MDLLNHFPSMPLGNTQFGHNAKFGLNTRLRARSDSLECALVSNYPTWKAINIYCLRGNSKSKALQLPLQVL